MTISVNDAVKAITAIIESGPKTIAVCGGRSVKELYASFARDKSPGWRNVTVFLIDERCVPLSDPESNFKLVSESFADACAAKLEPFIVEPDSQDRGSLKYYSKLYPKTFDITIIAAGEDGHVAALYPNHKALEVETSSYVFVPDSPKPPAQRVTASAPLIVSSKHVFLLFMGEAKRSAYEKFLDESVNAKDCPAKIVKGCKNLHVVTDLED